jgi:prepilin-type N-terminal cleavage/methylation domain-containing protein
MLKKNLRNQKGFTLIEIIAVLVILGILAAVAIPKFLDLQNDAKKAAARGFVASGQSAISMGYASNLLGNATPTGPDTACGTVVVDVPTGVVANVTCTGSVWTVASSVITAYYDGQSATGTWTRP